MAWVFLCCVSVLVAFFIAIKVPLYVQTGIAVAGILYARSSYVREKEIGGILDVALVVSGIIGLLAGDAYVLYRHGGVDLTAFADWLFQPGW